MLTVEINKQEERVEIYFDKEGIATLKRALGFLETKNDHDHLMTESWGGVGLTEELHAEDNILVNHLLLISRCGQ